jgi:hypothetical protein
MLGLCVQTEPAVSRLAVRVRIRDAQVLAWRWALANRGFDGSLPSGKAIGGEHGRHERSGRLVKSAGLAGEVTELLDRPTELYLRRRTHPKATVKYRAVDELDVFLLFLKRGLYVEPDPRQVAQALSWAGPPSPADLHRYEEQLPEIVDSYTQPMDAWYDSQLKAAAPRADKPLWVPKTSSRACDQAIFVDQATDASLP